MTQFFHFWRSSQNRCIQCAEIKYTVLYAKRKFLNRLKMTDANKKETHFNHDANFVTHEKNPEHYK